MTAGDLYNEGLKVLKSALNEDYVFDCDCLFNAATGKDKVFLITHSNSFVDDVIVKLFLSYIERRTSGEPLQYILGQWEFMGLSFFVGKGVLIPRPETELLVETANKIIKEDKCSVIFDLCAGSGAIGLSIANFNPECQVYLFEKYDDAFYYLAKNALELNLSNAHIIKCDVLNPTKDVFSIKPDLILSNPPYVKSEEISSLQKEVIEEPHTALDGGCDGLEFYKAYKKTYIQMLERGKSMVVECGDGQSSDIENIFADCAFQTQTIYDFNNVDRIVRIIV